MFKACLSETKRFDKSSMTLSALANVCLATRAAERMRSDTLWQIAALTCESVTGVFSNEDGTFDSLLEDIGNDVFETPYLVSSESTSFTKEYRSSMAVTRPTSFLSLNCPLTA